MQCLCELSTGRQRSDHREAKMSMISCSVSAHDLRGNQAFSSHLKQPHAARPLPTVSARPQRCPLSERKSFAAYSQSRVSAESLPLASYPFRQQQQQLSFNEAVRHLMMHLNRPSSSSSDDAVVHTTSPAGHRIYPVRKRDMRTWEELAGCHNMALYVEPLDNPSLFCGSEIAGGGVCTEADCHVAQARAMSPIVHGSVGDCCEEEEAVESVDLVPERSIDQLYMSGLHGDDLEVQYYGCLTRGGPEDGCYLIKTVRQQQKTSCHCMHFSLIRVCAGKGLRDQVAQFWSGPSMTAQA